MNVIFTYKTNPSISYGFNTVTSLEGHGVSDRWKRDGLVNSLFVLTGSKWWKVCITFVTGIAVDRWEGNPAVESHYKCPLMPNALPICHRLTKELHGNNNKLYIVTAILCLFIAILVIFHCHCDTSHAKIIILEKIIWIEVVLVLEYRMPKWVHINIYTLNTCLHMYNVFDMTHANVPCVMTHGRHYIFVDRSWKACDTLWYYKLEMTKGSRRQCSRPFSMHTIFCNFPAQCMIKYYRLWHSESVMDNAKDIKLNLDRSARITFVEKW